jgi:hypothetical protein
MPFYSRLTTDVHRTKSWPRIVVITTDDQSTAEQYLAAHGFQADQVLSSAPPPAKITGTPTLVLTKRGGVVDKVWIGRLDLQREHEVRKAMGV